MRRYFPFLVVVCALTAIVAALGNSQAINTQTPPASSSSAELTNNDVLAMAKSELSAEIILAKIQTSACDFDTSPAALRDLKSAGVPEVVILAMVKSPKQPKLKEERTPSISSQPAEPQRRVRASEVQAERSDTQMPTEGRRIFVRGNNADANRIRKKGQNLGCYKLVNDPSKADFFLDVTEDDCPDAPCITSALLSDKQGKTVWSGSALFKDPVKKMVKETCK